MELNSKIAQAWKTATDKGTEKIVLLCDSRLRTSLATMLSQTVPLLAVIAYDEIVLGTGIDPVETISLEQNSGLHPKLESS